MLIPVDFEDKFHVGFYKPNGALEISASFYTRSDQMKMLSYMNGNSSIEEAPESIQDEERRRKDLEKLCKRTPELDRLIAIGEERMSRIVAEMKVEEYDDYF